MMNNQFFLGIFCISVCLNVSAQNLYVSPNGNDLWNGLAMQPDQAQKTGPFQTLERAHHAIRELKTSGQFKEPVTIHIATGTYLLKRPLEFDLRDTGFAGREIIWQAEKNVMISGGTALTNCAKSSDKVWKCPVTGLELPVNKTNLDFPRNDDYPKFSLFVNHEPLHLARWPNKDWAHVKIPLDEKTTFTSFEQLPNIGADSPSPSIHIFPSTDWSDLHLPLASVDAANNTVKLAENKQNVESGRRFYLYNILSELDAPAEWFYDKSKAEISFIPAEQNSIESVIVSFLPNLIKMEGANFISFKNMAFGYSTETAIILQHVNNIHLDNIDISNVDTLALKLSNSHDVSLTNSRIYNTGAGGIEMEGGDRPSLTSANYRVENNHFHDMGLLGYAGSPAIDTKGVGSLISHNLIERVSSHAVGINGNDHIFEKNELSNACEQLSDCGAIYSGRNWTHYGNLIRYNHIHHLYGYGMHSVDVANNQVKYGPGLVKAVYLDDGVAGFNIIGNIMNDIGWGIHLGGGRNNLLENNYINTDGMLLVVDNRWPNYNWDANRSTLKDMPYQSPLWQAKYPQLKRPVHNETWPEGNIIRHNILVSKKLDGIALSYSVPSQENTISDNLQWDGDGPVSLVVSVNLLDKNVQSFFSWQDWLKLGVEKNSIRADPCAVIKGNKLSFCKDSPIHQIGFKPLPDDIGLRK